jgi:hypothetical protein
MCVALRPLLRYPFQLAPFLRHLVAFGDFIDTMDQFDFRPGHSARRRSSFPTHPAHGFRDPSPHLSVPTRIEECLVEVPIASRRPSKIELTQECCEVLLWIGASESLILGWTA